VHVAMTAVRHSPVTAMAAPMHTAHLHFMLGLHRRTAVGVLTRKDHIAKAK